MKHAVAESVCECQARLFAQVDEQRRAVRGWARLHRRELSAPANALGPENEQFHIGWMCPFCTRNTLRSFEAGMLRYRASQTVPPAAMPSPPRTGA